MNIYEELEQELMSGNAKIVIIDTEDNNRSIKYIKKRLLCVNDLSRRRVYLKEMERLQMLYMD